MRAVRILRAALLSILIAITTVVGWSVYFQPFTMHFKHWVVPLLAAGSIDAQIFVPQAVQQLAQQALNTYSK